MTDQWFSPDTLVSSTNKTDHHNIAEILLKVALNTINQTKPLTDATFNNISAMLWWSVLFVEETRVSGENH
jgi:hypothetical protein